MRTVIFVLSLLIGFCLRAQNFSHEVWHDGFLVTVNQDTIKGLVKYDMESNIVLVSRNNVVQSFSSHTIFYFEIFDKLVENYRQFYAIPYKIKYDYEIPVLFEVLYEGPLSLLSREAVVTESVNTSTSVYGNPIVRDVINYSFFFLDKQGKIDFYSGRKQDLFLIMGRKQTQVKSFVQKNKLNVDDIRDLIRITAFYNSL